jgi:hypothetical protein
MLLTYFLNDFEMVPVAPLITGITLVFTFHMRCISILRSLYFILLLLLLLFYYYYYLDFLRMCTVLVACGTYGIQV